MKFRFTPAQLERMYQNPWLTDRERAVFDLYYRRGWAIEDVAAELYMHRSTIDRALKSIRQKTIENL